MDNYWIEQIEAAAVGEDMPIADALIINVCPQDSVVEALLSMYFHKSKRVYFVEDTFGRSTPFLLDICENLELPCIVLCGENLPEKSWIEAVEGASLISQGSNGFPTNILSNIKRINWIGFQRYLTDPKLEKQLENSATEFLRLGEFRHDTHLAEPLLREPSCHFIDCKALRHCDSPDSLHTSPNGLYAEELCQLARYIGLGNNPQKTFIYGYDAMLPANSVSIQAVAQTLWHLLDGLFNTTEESPITHQEELKRMVVQLGENGESITFYYSIQTGRWWMEIPNNNEADKPWYIACNEKDYKIASSGNIPLKWVRFYQHYNNL